MTQFYDNLLQIARKAAADNPDDMVFKTVDYGSLTQDEIGPAIQNRLVALLRPIQALVDNHKESLTGAGVRHRAV